VISLLFNAFFASLMVMLVFSTGILVYTGMYCSPEARLLLTLPVRAETIHTHKFREAMWFSSWGFVLLGSPMLAAYGVVRHAAWPYYVLMLPLMISFVFIPASVGSIICTLLVAWMPRLRLHALTIGVTVACVAALGLGWSMFSQSRVDAMSAAWFERTFARLAVTEQKLFPSWWLSMGLIEAARTERDGSLLAAGLFESLKFLALLVAHALALQHLAAWVARVAYRRGYSQLVGEVPARRRRPLRWFDRTLGHAGFAAGRPLRLLLVKDLRLFRRDISQWSQFAIFFGLLGLYFLNLRAFNYHNAYASMIGYLNLAVVGLILSTFTTRFVYPMISLEGRRFWILGLLLGSIGTDVNTGAQRLTYPRIADPALIYTVTTKADVSTGVWAAAAVAGKEKLGRVGMGRHDRLGHRRHFLGRDRAGLEGAELVVDAEHRGHAAGEPQLGGAVVDGHFQQLLDLRVHRGGGGRAHGDSWRRLNGGNRTTSPGGPPGEIIFCRAANVAHSERRAGSKKACH
jgi:hypothetical protein